MSTFIFVIQNSLPSFVKENQILGSDISNGAEWDQLAFGGSEPMTLSSKAPHLTCWTWRSLRVVTIYGKGCDPIKGKKLTWILYFYQVLRGEHNSKQATPWNSFVCWRWKAQNYFREEQSNFLSSPIWKKKVQYKPESYIFTCVHDTFSLEIQGISNSKDNRSWGW